MYHYQSSFRSVFRAVSYQQPLRMFLKTAHDDADVTFSGRVFHIRAAATGKARSPTVERRVRWTTSDDVIAECRPETMTRLRRLNFSN